MSASSGFGHQCAALSSHALTLRTHVLNSELSACACANVIPNSGAVGGAPPLHFLCVESVCSVPWADRFAGGPSGLSGGELGSPRDFRCGVDG
eukprot:6462906-Amphidinium_carterae.1